jgi:choloylglycine hydrolase
VGGAAKFLAAVRPNFGGGDEMQNSKWMARAVCLLAVLVGAALPATALCCTTFLIARADRPIVGKSYDYDTGEGAVLYNPRGLAKQSLPGIPGTTPARWVSSYASLTVNQFGREFPVSGMNEHGLVIEIMWLSQSRYGAPDARPMVNELQWIQYQLDTRKSVAEVVAHADELAVLSVYAKVHYLACDATPQCAAFEFLDGKLVVTEPGDMVANVLTNNTYADSAAFLRKHKGFGGKRPLPKGDQSLARFVRAAAKVQEATKDTADPVGLAFGILENVAMGDYTKWNLVYDLTARRLHYRSRAQWDTKTVDLRLLDSPCSAPPLALNLAAPERGDVTKKLGPWIVEANRDLVHKSLVHIKDKLPPNAADMIAMFPESFQCQSPVPPTAGAEGK